METKHPLAEFEDALITCLEQHVSSPWRLDADVLTGIVWTCRDRGRNPLEMERLLSAIGFPPHVASEALERVFSRPNTYAMKERIREAVMAIAKVPESLAGRNPEGPDGKWDDADRFVVDVWRRLGRGEPI